MSGLGTTYRKRDDIKKVRETRDCILLCKHHLLELGATEDAITAIETRAWDLVEKPVIEAKTTPPADINLLVATGEVRRRVFFFFFARLINEPSGLVFCL